MLLCRADRAATGSPLHPHPTPSVDTSPPQRCTLRLHSLTDSAARLSAAVENGRRASSRQAGADTTQRRKSGVLRGSGGRGGGENSRLQGKVSAKSRYSSPKHLRPRRLQISYCQLCICTTDETLQRLIIDPQTEVGSAANVEVWEEIFGFFF